MTLVEVEGEGERGAAGTQQHEVSPGLAPVAVGGDRLEGGLGHDRLVGAAGSDVYVYGAGDGDDRIVDTGGAGDMDRLVFGAGITPGDITVGRFSRETDHLVLRLPGTGGAILLEGQLAPASAGVEEVRFDDGTIWNRSDLLARLQPDLILGTSAAETLKGSSADEAFEGGLVAIGFGFAGGDVFAVGEAGEVGVEEGGAVRVGGVEAKE